MTRKKKLAAAIAVLLALAAALFLTNAAQVLLLYQREALDCTWLATLAYMHATGRIPPSMDDLMQQGYLRANGKNVSLWINRNRATGKFTGTTDIGYVSLDFPAKATDLANDQGILKDKNTGKERFIVRTKFWLFPKQELRRLNVLYWQQWMQYDAGKRIKYCGFEFQKPLSSKANG